MSTYFSLKTPLLSRGKENGFVEDEQLLVTLIKISPTTKEYVVGDKITLVLHHRVHAHILHPIGLHLGNQLL